MNTLNARQWAETVAPPKEGRPFPLLEVEIRAEIEHGVTKADSGARFLMEAVAWILPLIGLSIFLTPGTRVLEMEPVPPHVALPVSAIAYLLATAGPILTLSRWLGDGKKSTGLTTGTNVYVAVLSALGLLGMFLVSGHADLSPLPWVIAPMVSLVAAVIALVVQAVYSAPKASGAEKARLDRELLRTRSELLSILHRRGLIDSDTYRRADASPFGQVNLVRR